MPEYRYPLALLCSGIACGGHMAATLIATQCLFSQLANP